LKDIFPIFEKYLPLNIYCKIKKYTTNNPLDLRSTIDWNFVKNKLDNINLAACHNEIQTLLSVKKSVQESDVTVFHIEKNDNIRSKTEPTPTNTTKMIYKFLATIYQRNIICTIVKYILLQPLLKLFSTSKLIPEKKGIFYRISQRLNEILFECVLLSFNGSNYDNYLICNSLITIQSHLREKIKLFKKGASISTVIVTLTRNLPRYSTSNCGYSKKLKRAKWSMKLYFKDVRNLVAANMSLDKVGKLFNLEVSKLAFPYEQATSISKLKNLQSLHAENDIFWKNSFNNRAVPLENRLEAQTVYNINKFTDLYSFSCFYLKQDCLLLHSIVLILFSTYLSENVNLFTRRNFSQSSLAFQQFFVVEPSRQISKLLAPKVINNTFYNHLFKQAVTGGLCTSFVHGKISDEMIINEIFNYIDKPTLCPSNWPNFEKISPWKKAFDQKPTGICTLDIRSLYPSASVKKLPVNMPLFYTRFTKKDHLHLYSEEPFYRTLNIGRYCDNVRQSGNLDTDLMQLTSERPRFQNEFYALVCFLASLPSHIEIIRWQSAFTAFGQLFFVNYPVDGYLTYRDKKELHIKLVQYQSTYFHGHRPGCKTANTAEEQIKYDATVTVINAIQRLCEHFTLHFNQISDHPILELVNIWDCDFHGHKIPRDTNDAYLPFYKTVYTYPEFVAQIRNKKLTGLVVVKNLKIALSNQNPIFGFVIQKIEYDLKKLSPYTQEQVTRLASSRRVVAVHEAKGYMILSTQYFNWLEATFGFKEEPVILHAVVFQLDDYLRKSIESKLAVRQSLKLLIKQEKNLVIKQNYEVKAELIKLMLNSCYGYTLCNLTSTKFKQYENRTQAPRNTKNIATCFQFSKGVFLVQTTKTIKEHFSTMLGHVGCYILFYSKIILLKRLYFLLKYLDPRLSQLLYMDTDSAHILVKHSKLLDNVDSSLQKKFSLLVNKHFETGPKLSGIWVEEGFFQMGEYLGEKSYRLYNRTDGTYLTHMKGLNSFFQTKYHKENVDSIKTPYLSFNIFFKSPDFLIFKTNMSKNLFTNYVPNKRYFVSALGSLPLRL
jgi:hypothetical protein